MLTLAVADISTVVSIFDVKIEETKPGLSPGYFEIPPGSPEKPAVVHVKSSTFPVYLSEGRIYIATTPSSEIARSLVEDYVSSQLEFTVETMPGLFWLRGEWSLEKILSEPETVKLLKEAEKRQTEWFRRLCKLATNDWNRYHQHNVISTLQRKAALTLGLSPSDYEWMVIDATRPDDMKKCPACSVQTDKASVLCPNCRFVYDQKAYKEMQFA
jgi:hypothetical protein